MRRGLSQGLGGWLPRNRALIAHFYSALRALPDVEPADWPASVTALAEVVSATPGLTLLANAMFVEANRKHDGDDPLNVPGPRSWDEFLAALVKILTTAPMFYTSGDDGQAAGLIGFPINALLDWPMATRPGYDLFSNQLFNQKMRGVLQDWSVFLASSDSAYVLDPSFREGSPAAIGWLSDCALEQINQVALSPTNVDSAPYKALQRMHGELTPTQLFQRLFDVPDPADPLMGFSYWDAFFTRLYNDSMRPVGDTDIVSACESAPLQYVTGVKLNDTFWAKGQPYSLSDMLNEDPRAAQFEGGSVYQAFLSALSYHRWNSPVDGTIVDASVVPGTYYLENAHVGFLAAPGDQDGSAPNFSQPFLSSVATRAVIFIQADNDDIGLMAMVPIGMAEVSSCEVTVRPGDRVSKGDQVGMFHFGGSTHCLVFRPGVALQFAIDNPPSDQPDYDATNVGVKGALANVVKSG